VTPQASYNLGEVSIVKSSSYRMQGKKIMEMVIIFPQTATPSFTSSTVKIKNNRPNNTVNDLEVLMRFC
jgi:hypothetical protein